ncbi:related to decapping enzyme [Melanopsichium pennsylvanicum]|uniref:Related to decapping enzyme n=2 Tax=Melanopsichium pennsylvanicum TaxID=63383 RepID=A0AAJ5C4K6_9BASI|nr:related to decapping enzyme [Melanopsichium pennsylvanicum 4]SNX83747.1 related to decapping enzyme [Melanopsichium pennsylvanicum]
MAASISEARQAFNLKVLRRHDASIVSIVSTASFVVLYNYNSIGEWTKTGVEGPLFLFRRRKSPYNGFFLMNRNGVENFSADITPEDDLEITPEFIIYRPETSEEVYGIWVFEPNQRMGVGSELLRLQQIAEAPSDEVVQAAEQGDKASVASDGKAIPANVGKDAAQASQQEGGKSAKAKANGKDKKKGGSKQAERSNTAVTQGTSALPAIEAEPSTQISLDDLFGSAAASALQAAEPTLKQSGSAKEKQSIQQPASSNVATSLLDSLFQSAVSLDSTPAKSSAAPSSDAETVSVEQRENKDASHSQNLLALLDGGVSSTPAPATNGFTESRTPSILHQTSTESKENLTPAAAAVKLGGEQIDKTSVATPLKMSLLIEDSVGDRIGLGDDGQPLSRREFVTELLSLIHTNPDFVSSLYDSYLARVL